MYYAEAQDSTFIEVGKLRQKPQVVGRTELIIA